MYLDAREFLDEEREAWRPFEVLADLADEQLTVPVEGAHGWTGRQLVAHLLSGHEVALAVAAELAVSETSPAKERADADWDARGGEVVNAEIDATWAALSMDDLRSRFATLPGELRDYLTVVPESRWLKKSDLHRFFRSETTAHCPDHLADLAAILAEAGRCACATCSSMPSGSTTMSRPRSHLTARSRGRGPGAHSRSGRRTAPPPTSGWTSPRTGRGD